ncbi:hypothetical protein [Stratiformator vulcanicus]|uniref:Uncharacterized protein n=1 Tax=Stratiformator vulcanicus TaxID=2527980 RepID=A0A517QZG0_9PLAN|nr:hypothetical protein [Stratiformator vulcanicus]QDT37032.1 hypothetical protein Pan189_13980 [Stratiformator vulcanicus]
MPPYTIPTSPIPYVRAAGLGFVAGGLMIYVLWFTSNFFQIEFLTPPALLYCLLLSICFARRVSHWTLRTLLFAVTGVGAAHFAFAMIVPYVVWTQEDNLPLVIGLTCAFGAVANGTIGFAAGCIYTRGDEHLRASDKAIRWTAILMGGIGVLIPLPLILAATAEDHLPRQLSQLMTDDPAWFSVVAAFTALHTAVAAAPLGLLGGTNIEVSR